MRTWTIELDFAYSGPAEQSAREDALENGLTALMDDPVVEGGALAMNTAQRAVWVRFDIDAENVTEALANAVTHAQRAIESGGFEIAGVIRAEIAEEAATVP